MTIREKEQRKFRTLLKHMAIHESDELDIFSWTYCLKYGFDKNEFFDEHDFMYDMLENNGVMFDDEVEYGSEKYYELYEYATATHKSSRALLLSAAADKFCEETLKCEYIPSFLWKFNAKNLMFDAFTAGVVNRVNVYIKSDTLFNGVNEFITMDDKPNFETCKPWDSVALRNMNEYYAISVAYSSSIFAQKASEDFRKMLDDLNKKYDDLISVDSIVSKLLQCQQEGIKSCRKILQNASEDEEIFNAFTHGSTDIPRLFLENMFWIRFHDYFLKKEK